jgi:hypothetical protein
MPRIKELRSEKRRVVEKKKEIERGGCSHEEGGGHSK